MPRKNQKNKVFNLPTQEVRLGIDKGRYRLTFSKKISREIWSIDKQYRIYIGLAATPENSPKAEEIRAEVERDILYGKVDRSGERYFVKNRVLGENFAKDSRFNLLKVFDDFCEAKKSGWTKATYNREYKYDRRNIILKALESNSKLDIRKQKQVVDCILSVTTLYQARKVIDTCRRIIDRLVLLGDLPSDTKNSYKVYRDEICGTSQAQNKPRIIREKGFEGDRDTRAFEVNEVLAILEMLKHVGKPKGHWHPYVKFLYLTGCRPGEAAGLKWRDISEDFSVITFRRSWNFKERELKSIKTEKKGDKPVSRKFPVGVSLKDLLVSIRPANYALDDLIFTCNGKPINNIALNHLWVGQYGAKKGLIEKLLEEGKVKQYLKIYALRHTFIYQQLSRGQSVADIAYWVGNTPETIFKHYVSKSPNSFPSDPLAES